MYNDSEKKKMACKNYTIMNQQASSDNCAFSNNMQQKMVMQMKMKKME